MSFTSMAMEVATVAVAAARNMAAKALAGVPEEREARLEIRIQ